MHNSYEIYNQRLIKTTWGKSKIPVLKIQSFRTYHLLLWRYPVKYSSNVKNRSPVQDNTTG